MSMWDYDKWPSGEPYSWPEGGRGHRPDDQLDFHVDLGCGKVKKGRIGVDRYPAPGVNVLMDLEYLMRWGNAQAPGEDAELIDPEWVSAEPEDCRLPFPDSSIESMVSHHALEHIGDGFIRLMDECYRVLKPGAIFRIIVPLFPSWSAVSDPDHKRYFMAAPTGETTFDAFCGTPDHHWAESFSVPYTQARFAKTDVDMSPASEFPWTPADARELRVTLRPVK